MVNSTSFSKPLRIKSSERERRSRSNLRPQSTGTGQERQPIEMISVRHSALDAESKVETLFTCKRSVAETLFSAKSTLDLSATLRGVALDSVSSTE
jgi:hypothetical protein